MRIKEYLCKYQQTLNDIAIYAGVTKHYIWMISKGRVNPSASLAEKISCYTNGEVKIHEIRKCTKTCAKGCDCAKGARLCSI